MPACAEFGVVQYKSMVALRGFILVAKGLPQQAVG